MEQPPGYMGRQISLMMEPSSERSCKHSTSAKAFKCSLKHQGGSQISARLGS